MICVFPFHQGDVPLLNELLLWIRKLGGVENHHAVLVADGGVNWEEAYVLLGYAREAFCSANLRVHEETIQGWPQGSNALFWLAADSVPYFHEAGPWLFCEPDCVPMRSTWLDEIQTEYFYSRKDYLGAVTRGDNPPYDYEYVNGTAVYPHDFRWRYANRPPAPKPAFDLQISDEIMPRTARSKTIQHFWGKPQGPPIFGFQVTPKSPPNLVTPKFVKPETALFHRCKNGSLITILRQKQFPFDEDTHPHVFVQLGCYGDIIHLLPAFKAIHDRHGKKPIHVVSRRFAGIHSGVSYLEPVVKNVDTWMDLLDTYEWARKLWPNAIMTQCDGKFWSSRGFPTFASYQATMWNRTGMLDEIENLPLVFDNRAPGREERLAAQLLRPHRPNIAYNFWGVSSPCPQCGELRKLFNEFRPKVNFIDLGPVRAVQIYDLLGLYDRLDGLLTIDTSTLHLARGSSVPYIALLRPLGDGGTSLAFGNVALRVHYNEIPDRIDEIRRVIQGWIVEYANRNRIG